MGESAEKEHPEEVDPLFNWDGTPKLSSNKRGEPGYQKPMLRWNRPMMGSLSSLVRIKKPHMKDNTKVGKEDEGKCWGFVTKGLLILPDFANGVSEKAVKKKFWDMYKAFKAQNSKLESATGNLPEEYGDYERDMIAIMKEYEPKRQSQEDAKAVDKARLAQVLIDGGTVRDSSMRRGSDREDSNDVERPEKRQRNSGGGTTAFQDVLVQALTPAVKSEEDKEIEKEERDREHELREQDIDIRRDEAKARTLELSAQREHNAQETKARTEEATAQRKHMAEEAREQREDSKAQRAEEAIARKEEAKAQREQTLELMQLMIKMVEQKK
mmetsp:Transcript_14139/g.23931  ORF Transcript_14139/g.23931 Transcript_14139/m.23931 type:complete len:327 (-) Transcript_14139:308-1288(-)|eukprot:CAMPEP_0198210268 /NCGR_PEP_ID=MMETSP1445-20131203/19998_1 /TAXON_ID=36898 /ORGANISM="Pyramimonas sp., Strain CCMP2087" /LENGTH=326 /DNA_ID=CAMNT_0043884287 /DNA_START=136 /DNA_END=1116 /DNA_ORIENTATION=-